MVLNKLQTDNLSRSPSLSVLQQLGSGDLDAVPEYMTGGDKLPYDQLWQDIMQNLHKSKNSRKYIYVTHSELDRLAERLDDPDQNQVQVTPAVFFTCGHYFTKSSFMKELDKMNKDTTLSSVKLPETLSVIRGYYDRKGCIQLACPRCVISAIMSIS
jgi:hypothetical protein